MISISELLTAEKRFFELIDYHNAGRSKDGDIEELESLLAEINQQARTVIDLVKREQAEPKQPKAPK